MNIQSIHDPAFKQYGRIVTGCDFGEFLAELRSVSPLPESGTVYEPGCAQLEALPVAKQLSDNLYGGMPIQVGYCNGRNRTLNCLEYHRGCEVAIPADDIILLVAPLQKAEDNRLDTACVEAFRVPAGTAVLLYETTLHYAPCSADSSATFRVSIVLPKGTNTEKPDIAPAFAEDPLLLARNKWLIAHPDSPEAADGAFVGLTGENITL